MEADIGWLQFHDTFFQNPQNICVPVKSLSKMRQSIKIDVIRRVLRNKPVGKNSIRDNHARASDANKE